MYEIVFEVSLGTNSSHWLMWAFRLSKRLQWIPFVNTWEETHGTCIMRHSSHGTRTIMGTITKKREGWVN